MAPASKCAYATLTSHCRISRRKMAGQHGACARCGQGPILPTAYQAGALADARRNRANSQTNLNEALTRLAQADAQWPGSSNAHNCLPLDPKSHPSVNQTAEEGHAPFCRLEYSRHDFRAQTKHVQTSPAARAATLRAPAPHARAQWRGSSGRKHPGGRALPRTKRAGRATRMPAHRQHRCKERV